MIIVTVNTSVPINAGFDADANLCQEISTILVQRLACRCVARPHQLIQAAIAGIATEFGYVSS